MASVRPGVYRESEFRDSESNYDSPRRVFSNAKKEYNRIRNCNRGIDRVRGRNVRDRFRVSQKDIKERMLLNGGYRSSSSRSDSSSSGGDRSVALGLKLCGFSVRTVDKEPGELSSESVSDDAVKSESQVKDVEAVRVAQNGKQSPRSKKRKFSPFVWDQDDKEVSAWSNGGTSAVTTRHAPPPPSPPLSKTSLQSPSVLSDGIEEIHPVKKIDGKNIQSRTPVELPPQGVSVQYAEVESPVGFSPVSHNHRWSNGPEADQPESEDYVPSRNISSSRWAAGSSSLGDKSEITDDEDMQKRRGKMSLTESLESRGRSKVFSPETVDSKET